MFRQATLFDSSEPTSLVESAAGSLPCSSPDGRKTSKSGQGRARVSRSQTAEAAKVRTTNGTSGLSFEGLSPSAALQRSLESRLRARLDVNGSPEFALTWKHWDMQSGPQICALRASPRRTGDKGCSGWATPAARDYRGANLKSYADRGGGKKGEQLPNQVAHQVTLSGWNTPHCPRAHDSDNSRSTYLDRQIGATTTSSNAETESPGALNPEFVCWLMGFPIEWDDFAATVTLSRRKSRPSS
jgi:hypothetical protein